MPRRPPCAASWPSRAGRARAATVLAGFAYVLSRAAHADLTVTADETRQMERIVVDIGKLPEAQAVLVVEIAKNQADLYGGTEDYLVTREFAAHASAEQRRRRGVLRCRRRRPRSRPRSTPS
jgi:hypothetical protein